jgi:hypothetical protein
MGNESTWKEVLGVRLIQQDLCGRREYDERELDVVPTYLIVK